MSSELKVGVLFFLGLGLVTAFVFFFSQAFQKQGEYAVRFERIVRLVPGDAVLYNGVKVGTVTGVQPVVGKDAQGADITEVEVQYSVDGAYREAVLVSDQTVYKIDQGLLGGSALSLLSRGGVPINGEQKFAARGSTPAAIDETMSNLNAMIEENRQGVRETISGAKRAVERVGDMSEQIRDLVKENRAQVQTTIANVGDMAGAIRDLVRKNNESISQAIASLRDVAQRLDGILAENREQLKLAVGNFAKAGENVAGAAKTIQDTVAENRDSLKAAIDGIGKVGPRLDRISENLELVTSQIASGRGTIGKLVFEDTLHDKAVAAVDSVYQRAEEIKPVTAPLATLKFWGGIEGGYDMRTGASDTYAYLRIEPRPWKFYQGGISYRTAEDDRFIRREDPDKWHVDFNLLLGWRFFPDDGDQVYRLSVAGGIIDSQIGGWVSTPLWADRLTAKVMCRVKDSTRDFDDRRFEDGDALLRATLELNLWRNRIFVIAGGNDLIDRPGFWGGIRGEILDNDLRNLVSVTSLSP